jgi:hypothetical protein
MIANCKLQIANCKLRNACVPLLARKQCLPLMALIIFFLFCCSAFAGSSEAAGKVSEGIAQFQGGDFKAAAEAFSAADEVLPNELKIAFDRGCAYAAGGEYDKAIEQFQKAAAASDHELAGLANYNLGCVAVAQAKAKLGDKPEEAEGEIRTAALECLVQAARHYHDALSMDRENSDTRYNLETIRLWIKHIQDVWQKRDRQKRRDSMNLLQYLEWLESEQRSLMQIDKELGAAKPSPRQREAIRAAENAQRTLAEEIQPLKEKIAATLSAPPQQQPGANQAASPSADVQKAVELLQHLADDIRGSMGKAADSLAGGSFSQAAESQSQAVETIDQIFMAVAPYANLVERGINRQEELINQSPATEKQEKSDDQNAAAKSAQQPPEAQAAQHQPEAQARDSKPPFDGNEAAWNQRFIARYGRILSAKARRELEQLDAAAGTKQEPPPQSATSTAPNVNAAQAPDKDRPGSDEQLKADEQRRDLKEALQLGVQSAPKVEKLADEAALQLEENKPDEALPKQQEALKLLKDMLPKEQQKEQEKKDKEKKDQEKKDQDKKDQNKKDQDKKDQEKKEQQQKEQEKNDQGKQDQKKQDRQKKDETKNQQQQDQQPQTKRDLNKEKAEAVLQRARQREDQHRELEKKLEGYLYRPEKVEKDW